MKKIKRLKDLKQEHQRLSRRESELEELIQRDWMAIREATKLRNILKNWLKTGEDGKRSWIDRLSLGLGIVAGVVARRAENKIEAKLAEKIRSFVRRWFTKKNKAEPANHHQ